MEKIMLKLILTSHDVTINNSIDHVFIFPMEMVIKMLQHYPKINR